MSLCTPRTRAIARWQAKKSGTPEQELQNYVAWRYGTAWKVPIKQKRRKKKRSR
jgi:hypothetical protein